MSIQFRKRSSIAAISTAGLATALLAAGCGGAGGDQGAGTGEPITMWIRQVTESQANALVDEYNATHERQVELTVIPADNYLQRIGVAAGADELPCLMASDVVYAPNFIDKGLLVDISERIESLDFADSLAPGHMEASSKDGSLYAVPFTVAISVIFQNEVLLEKAGIDPEERLESLEHLRENALAVSELGDEVSGFNFYADNAGTISFTMFPSVWADGGEVLSDDGTESMLDSPEAIAVFDAYNRIYHSGASPEDAPSLTGATRNEAFGTGNVGYVLASNSVLEAVPETDNLRIGVQAIPGASGGGSTFLGGDVLGISTSCDDVEGAWDFLSWSMSEDAQVGVYGAMNQLTVRTDLAENEYSAENPNLLRLNEIVASGRTPIALRYAETFNDPQGPALEVLRAAIFGDDAASALIAGNDAITQSLSGK